jgi:hypothetical protein
MHLVVHNQQGHIELMFVGGTITNQWYLQQLESEVILVIQGAGHVDTTFSQQDGVCPHTANVFLDVLHDVFGSCVLSNQYPEPFGTGGSTKFKRHEFLQLFPMGVPQGLYVLHPPTHCSGDACGT